MQLPPALAQARACEVLDLSQNPALELSRADAEGVLLRMPCLGLLLLGKWPGCTATMDWRTGGAVVVTSSLLWGPGRRMGGARGQGLQRLRLLFHGQTARLGARCAAGGAAG